jgi:hypothetical protein
MVCAFIIAPPLKIVKDGARQTQNKRWATREKPPNVSILLLLVRLVIRVGAKAAGRPIEA